MPSDIRPPDAVHSRSQFRSWWTVNDAKSITRRPFVTLRTGAGNCALILLQESRNRKHTFTARVLEAQERLEAQRGSILARRIMRRMESEEVFEAEHSLRVQLLVQGVHVGYER